MSRAWLFALLALVGCAPGSTPSCPEDAAPAPDAPIEDAATGRATLVASPPHLEVTDVCTPTELEILIGNDGTAASGPLTPTFYGPDSAFFSLVDTTCGAGVSPGASCAVRVRLTPTTQLRYVASVHVVVGERTYTVPMIVEGASNCGPDIRPLAPTLRFDDVVVGGTGHGTLTLVNRGRADAPSALALEMIGSASFAIVASEDACSGTTLAAGATCTVGLSFTPTAPGTAYARLRPTSAGRPWGEALLGGTGI